MGDPGTVVASEDLPQLILVHALHGLLVGGWVVLDWDQGGHAAHGVDLALVARIDQQLDVAAHEAHLHGDLRAVGQDELWMLAQGLDEGEDVVPAAAVQPAGVVAELVDNLVELEHRWQGFNQDGGADGASWDPNVVFGEVENVVPELGFQVVFHLWQVKVWAELALDGFLGVVVKVDGKIENRAADRLAVNEQMVFIQVPSSWSDD